MAHAVSNAHVGAPAAQDELRGPPRPDEACARVPERPVASFVVLNGTVAPQNAASTFSPNGEKPYPIGTLNLK